MREPSTDIHATVRMVEQSELFRQFIAENPHHYLVHAFTTAAASAAPLELGYYGKESDRITVFKTNPISMLPPEEVFKEQGALSPLDLSSVFLGTNEALAKAEQYRMQAYERHAPMKIICILQQAERPVWNMTIVTATLNMINVKIDAMTGQMLHRDMQSIMSMTKD